MAKKINYDTSLKTFDICGCTKSKVELIHVQCKNKIYIVYVVVRKGRQK